MADKTNERTSLTNEAIYWRGLFIQRYAGIEFSLTHLLVMASYNSAYSQLGEMPYRQASKLKRLEALIEGEGPLAAYATELRDHVTYFKEIEEDRHFIAHGIMVVRVLEDEPTCLFRMYLHIDGAVNAGVWNLPLRQLKELAEEIQPHSTAFTALVSKIGKDHLIGQ
jgi:hypothetical protein